MTKGKTRAEERGRTLETASRGPLTLRMRSGLPGMLSETMTRAPDFSLISLTWEPAFPMMMDASWVTMRQRMWMCAEGGGGGGGPDEDDGWPVVAALAIASAGEEEERSWSGSGLGRSLLGT